MNRQPYILHALLTAAVFLVAACSPSNPDTDAPSTGQVETGHEDNHGSDDGDNHDDEAENFVSLTPAQRQSFAIEVAEVESGSIPQTILVPAEVRFNANRLAHVTPRIPGIVRSVFVSEGDSVEAGQVLAQLESRELADAKSSFLSAQARLRLARASFAREERLWESRISREQDYLDAQQALEYAQITARTTGQQLEALGIDPATISGNGSGLDLTRYEIVAPISGTIIERHAVMGELLTAGEGEPAFVIADVSGVWIDAAIYGNDISQVHPGNAVDILDSSGRFLVSTEITFVNPQLGESTRTGSARMTVESSLTGLRPGMFVSARIVVGDLDSRLRVPSVALQSIAGQTVVFVEQNDGFEARPVVTGLTSETYVEITSGLSAGERIAVTETFLLKSRLLRSEMGEGHGH